MEHPTEKDVAVAERARQFAPVVWLVGKVQSGKTSIIRTLTQASDAEIGAGFRACTKTARVFDFPEEAPIIRFLDTRGLGEVAYEPAADIAFCESRSHLILAVVKALDLQQQVVIDTICAARERHPDWPVVVAQTSLHEGYEAGQGHVLPYPFTSEGYGSARPEHLVRALAHQRSLFEAIPGKRAPSFVPIDFTHEGDGLEPADYGHEALIDALIAAAPSAVALALNELPHGDGGGVSFDAHILGFALAAGASDAFPVAGAVLVPAVQAAMLRQLAQLHGIEWDKRAYAEFGGALGTGILVRTASTFGIRQLVKLIPVYGQTAGAAAAAVASFATTYAIGKAASLFLKQRQRGVKSEEIAAVYRQALKEAFLLARKRDIGATAAASNPR